MKKVFVFCLMIKIGILSSFGNSDTLKQYAKQILKKGEWVGVSFPPGEQVEFSIHVLKAGNKVKLLDNAHNPLYTQTGEFGSFKFISRDKPTYIDIYDEFNGQQVISYQRLDHKNITIYQLGDKDVEIKIKTSFTNEMTDTVNKHFVRFLCFLSSMPNRDAYFSISPKKLAPPNSQTEPLIDEPLGFVENDEDNILVDDNTYSNFKKYVFLNRDHFAHNYRAVEKDFPTMEINVDYKHRYYLNSKQMIIFFNGFINYIKREKMSPQFVELFRVIIEKTIVGIKEEKNLPSEPN